MTAIDYLLLIGAAAVGAYVVTRLFVGWRRSLTTDYDLVGSREAKESAPPDRGPGPPWQSRK